MHEIKNPSSNESHKYHNVIFFLFTSFLLLVIVREIAAQTQSLQQVYQGGYSKRRKDSRVEGIGFKLNCPRL